jgi:hypothetical protein
MNIEQAMEEFIELSVNILERQGIDAQARTTALKAHIEKLLEKYAIERETRLLDSNEPSKGCKLYGINPVFQYVPSDPSQGRSNLI